MSDPGFERIHAALAEFNRGNLEGYLALYAPEIKLHGYAPVPLDRNGVRAFYQGVLSAFPGCRIETFDPIRQGDLCAMRFVLHVVHKGPFMGAKPSGAAVDVAGITMLKMRGEHCVERWSMADMLGLMTAIGAVKPAGG